MRIFPLGCNYMIKKDNTTYTMTYAKKTCAMSLANKVFNLDRIKNRLDRDKISYSNLKNNDWSFSFDTTDNPHKVIDLDIFPYTPYVDFTKVII